MIGCGEYRRLLPWMIVLSGAVCLDADVPRADSDSAGPASAVAAVRDDESVILEAFATRRSGAVVESRGVVSRVLPDDLAGSRHQRFIVRLASGHTVLVSHNIDLAPRIGRLDTGDSVAFRGQYEWNDRGGVVHWTHHDPDGSRRGGWIRHGGREYR